MPFMILLSKKGHLTLRIGQIDIMNRLRVVKENKARYILKTKTIEGLKYIETCIKK